MVKGMKLTREYVKQQVKGDLLRGPLLLIVHYRIPINAGVTGSPREKRDTWPHHFKPDADNLDKYLWDCLSGILWQDDAQVAWCLRTKTQSSCKTGLTSIYAEEMSCDKPDYEKIIQTLWEQIQVDG